MLFRSTVADLRRAKLYTSAGDDTMTQWYKANGFQPRAMAMTDVLTGLTTGMIDAIPTTPLAAMSFQWFKQTPYMLDLGISPIVGATVVSKKTWDGISAGDRAAITDVSLKVEKQLQADVPKGDGLATLVMQNQGLKITKGTGPEWQQLADSLGQTMRGKMVPPDIYDMALKARDAYRQRKAADSKTAATAPAASAPRKPASPGPALTPGRASIPSGASATSSWRPGASTSTATGAGSATRHASASESSLTTRCCSLSVRAGNARGCASSCAHSIGSKLRASDCSLSAKAPPLWPSPKALFSPVR